MAHDREKLIVKHCTLARSLILPKLLVEVFWMGLVSQTESSISGEKKVAFDVFILAKW
jgi:hypothetical protein